MAALQTSEVRTTLVPRTYARTRARAHTHTHTHTHTHIHTHTHTKLLKFCM